MTEPLLTIGELARRSGVATSALRYWEELGLLPAPMRSSGQRRYPESALASVGVILVLRDAGFTLAEQRTFLGVHADPEARHALQRRKLVELDELIATATAAREAVEHGLRCPYEDILRCPNFTAIVQDRLTGDALSDAHGQHHRSLGVRPRDALDDGA